MPSRKDGHGPVHRLDAASVTATLERLSERVAQRFPESGLSRVCRDLVETSRATARRVQNLNRPYVGLQFLVLLTLSAVICAQVYVVSLVDWRRIGLHHDIVGIAQGLDAMVNLLLLA